MSEVGSHWTSRCPSRSLALLKSRADRWRYFRELRVVLKTNSPRPAAVMAASVACGVPRGPACGYDGYLAVADEVDELVPIHSITPAPATNACDSGSVGGDTWRRMRDRSFTEESRDHRGMRRRPEHHLLSGGIGTSFWWSAHEGTRAAPVPPGHRRATSVKRFGRSRRSLAGPPKEGTALALSGSRLHGIGIRMDLSTVQRWDQAACEPGRICWKQ
jgi:hypothetical protein